MPRVMIIHNPANSRTFPTLRHMPLVISHAPVAEFSPGENENFHIYITLKFYVCQVSRVDFSLKYTDSCSNDCVILSKKLCLHR
jgi:hypothetical protein